MGRKQEKFKMVYRGREIQTIARGKFGAVVIAQESKPKQGGNDRGIVTIKIHSDV